MNKLIIAVLLFSITLLGSCTKDKPDPGATAAVNMADEWWVKEYLNGTAITSTYRHFYSYNTSENDNTMWWDDRGTLASTTATPANKRFKAKAVADYSALTFAAANADNLGFTTGKKVTITNGKVLKGVGHSKTGNKTDSVFLNVEYSDDPGKVYTITGHARTFFIEDDY
jgi:hypothetical protein